MQLVVFTRQYILFLCYLCNPVLSLVRQDFTLLLEVALFFLSFFFFLQGSHVTAHSAEPVTFSCQIHIFPEVIGAENIPNKSCKIQASMQYYLHTYCKKKERKKNPFWHFSVFFVLFFFKLIWLKAEYLSTGRRTSTRHTFLPIRPYFNLLLQLSKSSRGVMMR